MKNLSGWRSVRVREGRLERALRQRHSLRLHGLCIGLLTLLVMWAVSHTLMVLGAGSLAVRYGITLGIGYLAYLGVLRLWGGTLAQRRADEGVGDALAEVADAAADAAGALGWPRGAGNAPGVRSGQGGEFGGGGASADYAAAEASALARANAVDAAGGPGGLADLGGVGDVAGGALEAAAGADEGAVVIVPVVAVFLIGAAVFFSAGALLLLFFGWEVLLAVAVELAFSYAAGRTASRVAREGWLGAAVRLTWKPLLGAIACAVALGAAVDYFVPQAHTLPQALKLMKLSRAGR